MSTTDLLTNAKVRASRKLMRWAKILSMLVTTIEKISVSFGVRIGFTNLKIIKRSEVM